MEKHGYPHYLNLVVLNKGDKGYSTFFAGYADLEKHIIEVQDWLRADKEEALSTVRHEFAHFLHTYSFLEDFGSQHGAGFKAALRAISGDNWKRDCLWTRTEKLNRVLPPKKTPKTISLVTCSCGYEFSMLRLPSYVRKGMFKCRGCNKIGEYNVRKVEIRSIPPLRSNH